MYAAKVLVLSFPFFLSFFLSLFGVCVCAWGRGWGGGGSVVVCFDCHVDADADVDNVRRRELVNVYGI